MGGGHAAHVLPGRMGVPEGIGKEPEMADKTKDPYGFAKEKVDEAYVALYEALEALESVGADFCTDHGYNGDTMDGYGLLDVVSDISDSLEGM